MISVMNSKWRPPVSWQRLIPFPWTLGTQPLPLLWSTQVLTRSGSSPEPGSVSGDLKCPLLKTTLYPPGCLSQRHRPAFPSPAHTYFHIHRSSRLLTSLPFSNYLSLCCPSLPLEGRFLVRYFQGAPSFSSREHISVITQPLLWVTGFLTSHLTFTVTLMRAELTPFLPLSYPQYLNRAWHILDPPQTFASWMDYWNCSWLVQALLFPDCSKNMCWFWCNFSAENFPTASQGPLTRCNTWPGLASPQRMPPPPPTTIAPLTWEPSWSQFGENSFCSCCS